MKTFLGAALAGLLLIPASHADDIGNLRFSGFGTLGVAFSDNEGGDYTANFEQREGIGRTTGKDYGLDSVFGLQADLDVVEGLHATAQLQSRRLADGTSTPYFEWANLKYHINADLSLRAGRVVAPMFMISESRAIGYAQTAARLPPDVYNINPVSYVDGGGINYQFELNDILFSANATAGIYEKDLPSYFGEVSTRFETRMINLAAESRASTFRIGYAEADIEFGSDVLDVIDNALVALEDADLPNASLVHRNMVYKDFKADFVDIGYTYDRGNYLLQAEYVMRRSDSFIVYDLDGVFLLGAYRIDRWTPYLRYSQINCVNSKEDLPPINAGGPEAPLTGEAGLVNSVTAALRIYDERETWTIGTRFEVADNYALKVQYDLMKKPADRSGFFINTTPDFDANKKTVDVYSVTLDFIF